jgi:3-oxoacyl-[acyl-carrier-protein] synthase-3
MTRILAVGHALPEHRVMSADLEQQLGLEAGWIERRTGIRERRYASPGEATADLAARAALEAIRRTGPLPAPIGMLLLATSTPDHLLPPTAPLVAHRLHLAGCGAIDLANACTGFLSALALGHSFCRVQRCSVLIVAANVLSRRINPADPMTAALFGDGAGAMVLGPATDSTDDVLAFHLNSRGDLYDQIIILAGGSRTPLTPEAVGAGEHLMRMARGPELYREAVRAMVRSGLAVLERAGLSVADVDWWVPHQANARIMHDAGARLGIGPERTISIVETIGNNSAASIPIALAIASLDGRIRPGQRLLLTAVGAGMTEAGAVIRWMGCPFQAETC